MTIIFLGHVRQSRSIPTHRQKRDGALIFFVRKMQWVEHPLSKSNPYFFDNFLSPVTYRNETSQILQIDLAR